MSSYKYLIIGGGVAGTTAAETLRKNDPDGTIAIVSDEPYPLYSRVLLSKPGFLRGEQPIESAWLKKKEWYDENKIAFLGGISATALDGSAKQVTLSGGNVVLYEKLLIATGAHARKWPIPGADKKGLVYLRTLDDAKGIIEMLPVKKNAVIIGSGLVSFEIADILRSLGIGITLAMRERYFGEPVLSEREGKMLEKTLEEKGVKILRQTEVKEVLGEQEVSGLVLKDETKIDCDIVFCMIGIVLPNDWLKTSGIGIKRGVLANEFLETNIPDVWTAGDGTEFNDVVLKETELYGNWMNSRAQGETAAQNMLGQKKEFRLVSFQTSHGFGNALGFVGDSRVLPGRSEIFRIAPDGNSLTRFIVFGGRIIGATLINRMGEMGTIAKLIQNGTDISQKQKELEDPNFDIKNIIN